MKNLTLSIDEELLTESRKYARLHHTSLNHMIREILEERVQAKGKDWTDEAFQLMDEMKVSAKIKKWNREDLYRV